MKVHGEGLADDIKSTTSENSNESELDLEDELDEDLDEVLASSKKIGGRGRQQQQQRKRMSLNSDGDGDDDEDELADGDEGEEEDGEEEEEEDGDEGREDELDLDAAEAKSEQIKREYSPEQSGDGKRPYKRAKEVNLTTRKLSKSRRLSIDGDPISPTKRGRKPRISQVNNNGKLANVRNLTDNNTMVANPMATASVANSVGIGANPTYYQLNGYTSRQYSTEKANGANYAAQTQCNQTSLNQYARHYASQESTNSSASAPERSALSSLSTVSLGQHAQSSQRSDHRLLVSGKQQLLNSPTSGQTNGTSPPAALSDW